MTGPTPPHLVVDLGCGNGASARLVRKFCPEARWVGIDILQSENARNVTHGQVILYDGVNLPFATDSLPLIYSNQVLEHVRHPEPLLRDVWRVLQPGGQFIGSTSQLEPYHSWSLWNYTIYGFRVLVEDAGLMLEEVRPGIDGIALVQRLWFGRRPEHSAWFKISPLNVEIDQWGIDTVRSAAQINLRKLQFCGQFSFRVRKPAPGSRPSARVAVAGAGVPTASLASAQGVDTPPGRPIHRRRSMRSRVGRLLRRLGLR